MHPGHLGVDLLKRQIGQFGRLRQNFTLDTDCVLQRVPLKKKCMDKQYPEELVDKARDLFQRQTHQKSQRTDRPLHQLHHHFPLPIQKKI